MEVIAGLELALAILTLLERRAVSVERVTGLIGKARAEGRDVTADELKALADQTDAKVAAALEDLAAVIARGDGAAPA